MRQHLKFILIVFMCLFFAGRLQAQEQAAEQPIEQPMEAPDANKPIVIDALEIRDMDINDVLKLLSAKSGLNIISGKNVGGRVTIFLQNVEVHDALTIILRANDLAYIEDRGIVQIVTSAEYEQTFGHKFGVETESTIIPLQSVKASDAVALLSQVKSQTGKIIADDQSNSLIIEEVPEKLKKILDYIKIIDARTELKVYKLQFVSAEALSLKLQEMVSPKIGSVRFDGSSNKLFIKDTPKKLKDMDHLIKQIDIARQTKVFKISYAKAEDLAKTVTPMLSKDVGTMQFDSRSNTLIVTDISPKILEIGSMIAALDKKDKEVLIEAKIVRIDLTDSYAMGINWERLVPYMDREGLPHSDVIDTKNNFSIANSTASVTTIGTLGRENYNIVLQMVATLTNSRILSNPQIAVTNNQEARILVGDTTPYVTSATTTTAAGPSTTADTVNFIDTGVKLHVTPTIHDDGYITMKIKPEVSSVTGNVEAGSGTIKNKIPIVNTSEIETTIRVKDGVTIIMGGLIQDKLSNDKTKIPVLGDIPLLGKVFRSETRSAIKSEIVIFLTPHIFTGDVHVDERSYPFEKSKSSEAYFNPLPKDQSTVPVP